MNKKAWLDYLFYNIGKQQYDFRLSGLTKKGDEVISTKWLKFSQLIFPLNFDESWKIEYINNREILPCEVVIDLEEKKYLKRIIKRLNEIDFPFYVFDTKSKGYHIHIFFNRTLSLEEKKSIIRRFLGDEQKIYDGTTIALEYAKHWKSGKTKEEIKWKYKK